MAVAIFGGSFDPVHSQHILYVEEAIRLLNLKKLFVVPSFVAPHKKQGARASGLDRANMCRLAFSHLPQVEVSEYELDAEGTSYSYLTCRHFKAQFPEEDVYFLVGADMLENFFSWKRPDDILTNVTLVACGRGSEGVERFKEKFYDRFSKTFLSLDFTGDEVSSTQIRTSLAFQKEASLPQPVLDYIRQRGLYQYPCIQRGMAFLPEKRQEHSYRVAQMATERARSVGVSEEQALLASALHDCAKYLPLDAPELVGFQAPKGTPQPVLHQYTGAYLAEHALGIKDAEILDAIRYHTSGRERMSKLELLIYLADLLEAGRDYPNVDMLRQLYWADLKVCALQAFREQIYYLKRSGKPVYPLTERAYQSLTEELQ